MKITRILVYEIDLPLKEGGYAISGGRSIKSYDSTVVRVETDEGVVGFGEVCPLGAAYLPAYAHGVRIGIAEIAPHLIGMDPTDTSVMAHRMDSLLKGHPYVKSPIDMACWDILGKVAGLSLTTLLGGRQGEAVQCYRAISQDTPERMTESVEYYRSEGYRRFQLKVGSSVDVDIARIEQIVGRKSASEVVVADANTGWLTHEALRVVHAVRELEVTIEQPCASFEENLEIRRHTDLPFVLDESIDSIPALIRAHQARGMDAINIKISKFGGLTQARQVRDLCIALGIAMTIEDSGGGDIATAAIVHLAHSTPERLRFNCSDCNSYVSRDFAEGAPRRQAGTIKAATAPGLGVAPDMKLLGEPILSWG